MGQGLFYFTHKEKTMNKEETCRYLDEHGIKYEKVEHKAVYNMEEMYSLNLPHPGADAKNVFVRDDKKQNYCLITVKGEKRVDLKKFRKEHGLRNLSFASPEELFEILKLTPGSVTPLGLLNDEEKRVSFYLDSEFRGGLIGLHPNENTASIYLSADDLVKLIEEHGNTVSIAVL